MDDQTHAQLADLARAWGAGGAGAGGECVGDGVKPLAPTQKEGKVWTVDGWTADQNKTANRRANKTTNGSSSTSSDSNSYSGDTSGSSTVDSSSGDSLGCGKGWVRSENSTGGCCACMCPTSRESAAPAKPDAENVVMPTSGHLVVPRRARFWNAVALKEDNARFLLLALVLLLYMVVGALIFQAFEEENEKRERTNYLEQYDAKLSELKEEINYNNVSLSRVEELLYIWGNMTDEGYKPQARRLWDFAGSFHFVYTVVSTIGYGAASPRTQEGKIFCIFYGLIGCSSGILFFNLFLERIITLLAFIMRARHERKQRQRAAAGGVEGVVENNQRRGSQDSMEDSSLDAWKPSVYWVMFYLTLASVVVAFLGAVLFMEVEEWTYADSLYFCFISFATIGFGDFVSAQEPNAFYGSGLHTYRFFNFAILVVGCCCIYSLFNVISITIKQFLNCIIKRIASCCARGHCKPTPRRNAVSPSRLQKHAIKRIEGDIDSMYGSETERKLSGEMVSMREYISTNKVSLAVMQKQLYETAQMSRGHTSSPHPRPGHEERFTPGQVGPLAIASSKLCDRS
ncbi:potassium channel subfamily K member 13-like isoform X2 [Homarus americanus]|uniref:potassium channel subfamily K member 13-like isoform X2 n=1 Tax=Homarus americanus TaxID=6706 RepID=UPI001C444D85|nr:potassium channel subfamily K member 13-like isoform X2 [Homarus americanus]